MAHVTLSPATSLAKGSLGRSELGESRVGCGGTNKSGSAFPRPLSSAPLDLENPAGVGRKTQPLSGAWPWPPGTAH